ncbi:PAS domain S-box protein [Campylobacter lari]|uniref:PAS domain S-box protein n=1 Tax=Campylobacter subantarcticus TaxID=497724 RepID=A0ABW9N689_9BACT|nr:PAS domain S-box protein [Campylobacter lari]MPB99786.1 PAS domain S-box protein [Campylobacter subantarcticus]
MLDLKNTIDTANHSMAIIEFNPYGEILNANENFTQTMGYSLSEIKGKHHSMFCEEKFRNSKEYTFFGKN